MSVENNSVWYQSIKSVYKYPVKQKGVNVNKFVNGGAYDQCVLFKHSHPAPTNDLVDPQTPTREFQLCLEIERDTRSKVNSKITNGSRPWMSGSNGMGAELNKGLSRSWC